MRVLSAIVLPFVLAVLDTRQHFGERRTIAPQLIGNDQTWEILQALQQLAKEPLGSFLISVALDQDVQHLAILIHRTPEVVETTVDLEEHFVEVPPVAGSRSLVA